MRTIEREMVRMAHPRFRCLLPGVSWDDTEACSRRIEGLISQGMR